MAIFDSISPKVALPIAVLIGGLLLTQRKASAKGSSTPNPLACPPFGIIPRDRVEQLALQFADQGVRDLDLMTSKIAGTLYPKMPTGAAITWPQAPPFDPTRMAVSVRCLWEKIRTVLGELDLPVAPTDDPKAPARVLNELISSEPQTGKLFKIKEDWIMAGETPLSIAYRALERHSRSAARNDQLRLQYIKCITRGERWNMPLYGSTYTSSRYPSLYAVDGYTLAAAFLPRNADPINAVVQGRFPERTIGGDGQALGGGGHFGLLWLPPIDEALLRQGILACGTDMWDDGSSTIDPPPQLLNLLSGAPASDLPGVND